MYNSLANFVSLASAILILLLIGAISGTWTMSGMLGMLNTIYLIICAMCFGADKK